MRKYLLALFTVAALSSCDSDSPSSSESGIGPVKWTMPTEGSQYRFDIVTSDSSGSSVTSTPEIDIFRIVRANVPFGKYDSTFRYGWSNSARQYHVVFDSIGNTGIGDDPDMIDMFPTGTDKRMIFDTIRSSSGSTTSITTGYRERAGKDKMTIEGKDYDAIKVIEKRVEKISVDGVVRTTVTNDGTIWFIPSLGFITKVERNIVTVNDGVTVRHYSRDQVLTDIL
jgi:hypothetical protein